MANISSSLTHYVFGLLTSDTGLDRYLILDESTGEIENQARNYLVSIQNSASDLAEKSQSVRYPAIYIYCDRLTNALREKFATFSGTAQLAVEVRCSNDRINGIEHTLERYADAVCDVMDQARGSWQDGAYYAGGYEIVYGTLKHGGKNYIQTAKITFEIEVSK
jgi:hypothetical protein